MRFLLITSFFTLKALLVFLAGVPVAINVMHFRRLNLALRLLPHDLHLLLPLLHPPTLLPPPALQARIPTLIKSIADPTSHLKMTCSFSHLKPCPFSVLGTSFRIGILPSFLRRPYLLLRPRLPWDTCLNPRTALPLTLLPTTVLSFLPSSRQLIISSLLVPFLSNRFRPSSPWVCPRELFSRPLWLTRRTNSIPSPSFLILLPCKSGSIARRTSPLLFRCYHTTCRLSRWTILKSPLSLPLRWR